MKYLKWMYLGGTIVSLAVMAFRAGLIPQSLTEGADHVREKLVKDLGEEEGSNEVWIDGKKFQANAKHIYEVDGVRSLVKKPTLSETQEEPPKGGAERLSTTTLGDKVLKNPMHAYTPEAMEELKRTLEEAQQQSQEKEAALKELLKE